MEPTALAVGGLLIGVRATDPRVIARLRALVPAHVVPDVAPPPNLSMLIAPDDDGRRGLHCLSRDGMRLLRTTSIGRLLRGALHHLDGYLPPPPSSVTIRAQVLVRGDDAYLVDHALAEQLQRIERRLGDAGFQVADVGCAVVTSDGERVRFAPPRLEVDVDALRALDEEHPRTSRERPPATEELRLRALVAHVGEQQPSVGGRVSQVARLGVDQRGRLDRAAVECLHRLDGRGAVVAGDGRTDQQLFALLSDMR